MAEPQAIGAPAAPTEEVLIGTPAAPVAERTCDCGNVLDRPDSQFCRICGRKWGQADAEPVVATAVPVRVAAEPVSAEGAAVLVTAEPVREAGGAEPGLVAVGPSNSNGQVDAVVRGVSGIPGAAQRAVTREELMEQGVPANQANAILVQQHQQQVLMESFKCFILCFGMFNCLLIPAILGVFIWVAYEYSQHADKDCDVPLGIWCQLVWCLQVWQILVRKPFVKIFCKFEQVTEQGQPQLPVPLRVKVLDLTIALFSTTWTCIGLYWISVSGNIESEYPACSEVATGLYVSVRAYAAMTLCFQGIFVIYMVGLMRILQALLRAGALSTNRAAPPGALEKNTEVIQVGHEALQEQDSCSICIEEFASDLSQEILLTKECKHAYHTDCLKGWLKVNRNCPLCRVDLGGDGPPAGDAPPAGDGSLR